MDTTLKEKIENRLCYWSNNLSIKSIRCFIVDLALFLFFDYKMGKNKFNLVITKNVDSFKFTIRRFRNATTGKNWWLINLVWVTICTNNRGED